MAQTVKHHIRQTKFINDILHLIPGTYIVKDMSRIGRDYLQVGFYTGVMFKEKEKLPRWCAGYTGCLWRGKDPMRLQGYSRRSQSVYGAFVLC